jgi:ABC-type amino acid transport substrate-binding protein
MRALAATTLLAAALAVTLPATGGAQERELQIDVVARVSGKFVSPADTNPPGFDIELLRRFASWYQVRTGQPARLQITYASTVPALLDAIQGGTDIGIGGITATAERQRLVDFSVPTLPVRSVVIAPPGVLETARWRQQIRGMRLGATVGSTNAAQVDRVAAASGQVQVDTSFTTNEAVFAALGGPARKLDAAIVDLPQYWTTGKEMGLVMVDSVGEPENMAFVLPKGSPLKAQLDQFLDAFTHSNDYFHLIRRYFGGDAEQMVRLSRGG